MTQENPHFDKLFWFCCACVAIGLAFLISLCFVPVPKGSERFADNVQGFMEGSVITAALAFILGGSLPTTKKPDAQIPVTGDNPQVTINPSNDTPTP